MLLNSCYIDALLLVPSSVWSSGLRGYSAVHPENDKIKKRSPLPFPSPAKSTLSRTAMLKSQGSLLFTLKSWELWKKITQILAAFGHN